MSRCNWCTSTCGTCVGQKSQIFCNKLDPDHNSYNKAYGPVIAKLSCIAHTGTPINNIVNSGSHSGISSATPSLPPLSQQIGGFVHSMWDYAKSGFQNVTKEVYDERLSICKACEFYSDNGRCQKCNCVMSVKCHLATAECPVKRWLKINPATSPNEVTDEPDFSEYNNSKTVSPCPTCGH